MKSMKSIKWVAEYIVDMSSKAQARPMAGEYGVDGNAEFRVVESDDVDVLIEYLSDGEQIRLQTNRFQRQDCGQLEVV